MLPLTRQEAAIACKPLFQNPELCETLLDVLSEHAAYIQSLREFGLAGRVPMAVVKCGVTGVRVFAFMYQGVAQETRPQTRAACMQVWFHVTAPSHPDELYYALPPFARKPGATVVVNTRWMRSPAIDVHVCKRIAESIRAGTPPTTDLRALGYTPVGNTDPFLRATENQSNVKDGVFLTPGTVYYFTSPSVALEAPEALVSTGGWKVHLLVRGLVPLEEWAAACVPTTRKVASDSYQHDGPSTNEALTEHALV